jgi:hypothetical protein
LEDVNLKDESDKEGGRRKWTVVVRGTRFSKRNIIRKIGGGIGRKYLLYSWDWKWCLENVLF